MPVSRTADGDGCGDAVESSGATVDPQVLLKIPGPYGLNGLANSVENNDLLTAQPKYLTTPYKQNYLIYALAAGANACEDCDTDSIPNIYDIDDDNDGVLDSLENLTCRQLADLTTLTGGAATAFTTNSTSSGTLPNGTAMTTSEASAKMVFITPGAGSTTSVINDSSCFFNSSSFSFGKSDDVDRINVATSATAASDRLLYDYIQSSRAGNIYVCQRD